MDTLLSPPLLVFTLVPLLAVCLALGIVLRDLRRIVQQTDALAAVASRQGWSIERASPFLAAVFYQPAVVLTHVASAGTVTHVVSRWAKAGPRLRVVTSVALAQPTGMVLEVVTRPFLWPRSSKTARSALQELPVSDPLMRWYVDRPETATLAVVRAAARALPVVRAEELVIEGARLRLTWMLEAEDLRTPASLAAQFAEVEQLVASCGTHSS